MSNFLISSLACALLLAGVCPAQAQSASEERPVASFSRLSVRNGIDVYLTQSDRERLRIEVQGIELEDVMTEVDGDELKLYRAGPIGDGFFAHKRIAVYLDFVQLVAIEASGGSDIATSDDIALDRLDVRASGGSDVAFDVQAESLELTLSGGSDLRARGRARSLRVDASGGSDVSATSLDAERVVLRLSGGSDASIRATEAIEIDASGGSDVEVHGNPAERRVRNDRSSDVYWN